MRPYLIIMALLLLPVCLFASPSIDELQDLTGGLIPIISYDGSNMGGGELFSGRHLSLRGDVRYIVRVKNQTGDPIEADSLIVVVQQIQEMARLRDVTEDLKLPGADGYTQEGKPYFQVPMGERRELEPYGESEPFPLEINNPDLLRLYPPVLRVHGIRRTPSLDFQKALQTLVRKGVLTPEEAEEAINQGQGGSP